MKFNTKPTIQNQNNSNQSNLQTENPKNNSINQVQKSKTLCLYFELHQPFRLNLPENIEELEKKLEQKIAKKLKSQTSKQNLNQNSNTQDINEFENSDLETDLEINFANFTKGPNGENIEYTYTNAKIFDKVCESSYLPGLTFWAKMLDKIENLKLTLGLSGTFLEQIQTSKFGNQILEILRKMLKTGKLELLTETYYHSITSLFGLYSGENKLGKNEFVRQIQMHERTLQKLFDNYTPTSFRNTELIFNPQIGQIIRELGYKVQMASKPKITKNNQKAVNLAILKNSENTQNSNKSELKIALANFEATMFFFFTHRNDEFKAFFRDYPDKLEVLGTDFEIFGEHNGSSIFDLWENLLGEIETSWNFVTVSDLTAFDQKIQQNALEIENNSPNNSQNQNSNFSSDNLVLDSKLPFYQDIFPNSTTSWTNSTQNLVSWLGNPHQDQCFVKLQEIYKQLQNLENNGKLEKQNSQNLENSQNSNDLGKNNSENKGKNELETQLWDFFGKLSTSDNFYYLSDLDGDDGKLHAIFNAYPSPLIAFETFWRILTFFQKYLQTLE